MATPLMRKICKSCKQELALLDFPTDSRSRDGRRATCKSCRSRFTPCSIPECECNAHSSAKGSKGYCRTHYDRMFKYGDPLGKSTPRGAPKRFIEDVVLKYNGDDCVTWPYANNTRGYGLIMVGGTLKLASRVICEIVNGPPPTPEHHAAHSCGKGHLLCVAKRHLSWKTPIENMADKVVHGTNNRRGKHIST